jgi:hypothetical protein
LLDCPHEHLVRLSMHHTATAYLPTSVSWGWPSSLEDLYEPTWYFWCRLFCSLVPSPVPSIFLAFFWFGYRLFSKLPLRCPEAYIAM